MKSAFVPEILSNDKDVELQDITHGRQKAVARRALQIGETILEDYPTATIALPDALGHCYRCLRGSRTPNYDIDGRLNHKCTPYCEIQKPRLDMFWSEIHIAARERRWNQDMLANALLLAIVASDDHKVQCVLDFLPAPGQDESFAEIANVVSNFECIDKSKEALIELITRFRNNNHELVTEALYPVGIAVLAKISRACNHSCVPTAVICTRQDEHGELRVGLRLLRNLKAGEEISITYLDPVQHLRTRRDTLAKTYGFICACARCIFQEANPAPYTLSPEDLAGLEASTAEMIQTVYDVSTDGLQLTHAAHVAYYDTLPTALRGHIHHDNVRYVSQKVLEFAELGNWELAARTSMYLCAIYTVVYGKIWPLLGTQLLATAVYYQNHCTSLPVAPSPSQLVMAIAFARMARVVMIATIDESGYLESGKKVGGPFKVLSELEDSLSVAARQTRQANLGSKR